MDKKEAVSEIKKNLKAKWKENTNYLKRLIRYKMFLQRLDIRTALEKRMDTFVPYSANYLLATPFLISIERR